MSNFRNSNKYIYEQEAEQMRLRKLKSIVPYFDGYKIEGYFGKIETREEAERVVKMFIKNGV